MQILSAGIVLGSALPAKEFMSAKDLFVKLPSGAITLRVAKKGMQLLVEVYDSKNLDEVVNTVTAKDLSTRVCNGRGFLHLVDDVIIPPSIAAKLQAASVAGTSKECPLGDEADGGASGADLPTAAAVVAGTNITLATPSAIAKTNVEAAVNTTAVDSKGNAVPVDETLILGVDASLEEIAAAGANLINVRDFLDCIYLRCIGILLVVAAFQGKKPYR
jgi:hypothetical protein